MKNIIITGASGGIGKATALKFLKNTDYHLHLVYNVNRSAIDELMKNFPNRIVSYKCDMSDATSVEELAKKINDVSNSIDYIVYSAGISLIKMINKTDYRDMDKVIRVNLTSPIYLTSLLIPRMISDRSGALCFVSSMWGKSGASCESVYSATKGGLTSFAKSLAKELGPSNIRVNTVSPGFIDTPMNDSISEEARDAFCDEVPLERLGKANEVADAIYYLLSDEASYITGTELKVDGGYL